MRDLGIVIVIAVVAIVLRSGQIPLQTEEHRRGQFAVEMLRSGDWVVTKQQGLPFIDRPPAQYWVIAASFALAGGAEPGANAGISRWTLRAPTFIATVFTAMLVWWFARRRWGPLAGLAAGVAYPTMAMVLDIGRRAETEAQFTLFLSGALLLWQDLYHRARPALQHFIVGYGVCGLAALTKGTQAPVAFIGMVVLVLATRKDWRTLFSLSHLAGLVTFVTVVAIWQVPSLMATGATGFGQTWFLEASNRTQGGIEFFTHLFEFPFEFFVQIFPWGVVLTLYAPLVNRSRLAASDKADINSLVLTLAAIVIPVWLVAAARPRYVMPALPIVAMLVGIAVSKCASKTGSGAFPRWMKWTTRALAMLMVIGVVGMAAVGATTNENSWPMIQYLSIPLWAAVLQGFVGIAAGFLVFSTSGDASESALRLSVLAVGVFFAVLSVCTISSVYVNRTRDVEALIRQARNAVPGEELVSIGRIHHQFVFNWPRPIPVVTNEKPEPTAAWQFFVFNRPADEDDVNGRPRFRWREVMRIELDRSLQSDGRSAVIIGERLE